MRDDTLRTYKDAETAIYDGQGNAHDGYYCSNRCVGCPGYEACYRDEDEYHRCKNERSKNEN